LVTFVGFLWGPRHPIDQLDLEPSKDPEAGLPIIGTDAARQLDPERNRQAVRASRALAKSEKKRNDQAQSPSTELGLASVPAADAGDGT
jgi:hypothetical protein